MKYTIKGFCELEDLCTNLIDETSSIGELSPYCRTFSRNTQQYSANPTTFTDFNLNVFSYKDESSTILNQVVDTAIIDELNPILDWVNINSRNGIITSNQVDVKALLTTEFGTSTLNIEVGQMLVDTVKGIDIIVPTYIIVTNTDEATDYVAKIWFTDNAFQNQYDEFELVVIPVTPNLDDLFENKATVADLISGNTSTWYNNQIMGMSRGVPFTNLVTTELTWHQFTDNRETLETEFTTLIWGPRGNSVETIRDNLTNYILANSTHGESDWLVVYPDLFITDEFTIIPAYTSMAIGEQFGEAAIYSPITLIEGTVDSIKPFCPNYDDSHVETNTCTVPILWQSMNTITCGGPRNSSKSPRFIEAYSDYILASPGTLDYDRMSEETREVSAYLSQMIVEAFSYVNDGTYVPPEGFGTVIREGLIYIQAVSNDVTLLVLTKYSFDGILNR